MGGSIPPDSQILSTATYQINLLSNNQHTGTSIPDMIHIHLICMLHFMLISYTVKLKNAGKWMKIKQHSKNVFKIIFGNIYLHGQHKNIISCTVSSVWVHLLWLFPQWRIWFLFPLPLSVSGLLQKAKPACSAAGKQGWVCRSYI